MAERGTEVFQFITQWETEARKAFKDRGCELPETRETLRTRDFLVGPGCLLDILWDSRLVRGMSILRATWLFFFFFCSSPQHVSLANGSTASVWGRASVIPFYG